MKQKENCQEYKNGLRLSREYMEQYVLPMLKTEFSNYLPRMAAAFVGAGSEFYGYDDVMSQDGKFGVAYQLLLPGEDLGSYGGRLRERLSALPQSFQGYQVLGDERCGVMSVEEFYEHYLGTAQIPPKDRDWKNLRDCDLSTATNGTVFFDNDGRFSALRAILLRGYPERERTRRLADACEKAGLSGQYNLHRCISRRQWIAASVAAADFIDGASSAVFLLNNVYRPYFKWFPNAMKELPILGGETSRNMEYFSILSMKQDKGTTVALAENIAQMLIGELKKQGFTRSDSKELQDHAREMRAKASQSA